jgi:hypothetical protein
MPKVRLDIAFDEIAPLYRYLPDSRLTQAPFLRLDPHTGRISYGCRRDGQLPASEKEDRLFRWSVPPALRGDYCIVVAEALKSLLQALQDGYSEEPISENGKHKYVGRLSPSAQAAKHQVYDWLRSGLLDETNPMHVANIVSSEDFVRDRIMQKSAVGPDTTETGLALLCRECLELARDEGIFVDGALIDALTAVRDEMRETYRSRYFK